MTFYTKLYGDFNDLSVRVDAIESDGRILITGVFLDAFSDNSIYPLLSRVCVERLKREARNKKLRLVGIFTEPEGA